MAEPRAAVLLIGDELLSGRTRDVNLQTIAGFLAPMGIPVAEARIVSDDQEAIVSAVNALRAAHTYVFTTGGIGPTHDDITADAIAAAFGVSIGKHPGVMADLARRYAAMDTEFTEPRQRMARIPDGAQLIANPVSGAPGFQMDNVFTLAGVPAIVRAMLGDVASRLEGGAAIHSATLRGRGLREGDIAEALSALSEEMPEVNFGSYPWFRSLQDSGVQIVARARDTAALSAAAAQIADLMRGVGVEPEAIDDPSA
ncbi:MAG: molybdopterin-binding protein [Pseudomonadota bacterium]